MYEELRIVHARTQSKEQSTLMAREWDTPGLEQVGYHGLINLTGGGLRANHTGCPKSSIDDSLHVNDIALTIAIKIRCATWGCP